MAELKNTAIRLYRKYFGSPTAAEEQAAGVETVLTGEQAVALSEIAMSQTVVLGGGFDEIEGGLNVFGRPVSTMDAEGARGALAAAMGLGLSGKRATVFVDGQQIASAQDLLYSVSGRHLPLVVHLTNKAVASHGGAAGTGHEGFHLSAETGCFTLFAANVQEAVDFTYIARRVAEQCLVPGIVAMDAEQTADSPQNVHLLAPVQVRNFIGPADGIVTVPTVAQRLLFGRQRRRVPRWHDVDRPALQGALFDRNSFALGALGRQTFFDEHLAECLTESLERFARLTGRQYAAVSGYRLDNADTVLVVQGSAIETAKVAVDYLAGQKQKVGVLGLSSIRPLPVADITRSIPPKASVVVLERVQMAAGGAGPLTREIRLALDGGNARCHSVAYGLGGAPLRVADLVLVPDQIKAGNSGFCLGVDFTRDDRAHPKREVLLDTLERAYPGIDRSGVRERGDVDIPLAEGAVGFAVARKRGSDLAALAGEIGSLLYRVDGGLLRSRPDTTAGEWGNDARDYFVYSDGELLDPGDDAAVDVLVVTERYRAVSAKEASRLSGNGIVVVAGPGEGKLASLLSAEFLQAVADKGGRLFHASADDLDEEGLVEFALGATFSALIESETMTLKERKVLSSRQEMLKKFPDGLRDRLFVAFQQGWDKCSERQLSDIAASPLKKWDDRAPATVRALGRSDNELDSLPRFWDQVGVLYHDNEADELTVDPYLATGSVAPLSATFRDLGDMRSEVPVFDPEACTGCGKCWVACPDSAIGPVAISPAELINTGIRLGGAEPLRQVANQLSARIVGQARKGEAALTADAVLKQEFEWLKEKMSMTPERAETLESALDKAATALGELPLAVTDPLFKDAENVKKDSGEFLSLVVNPDVCKGCGICIEQCEPMALKFTEQDEAIAERAHALWDVWAETPDTPASTIERLMDAGSLYPLASLSLSRYCLHAMAGGDSAEPGSGEKIAMRMILASAEFHGQPLLNKFAWDAGELTRDLVQRIQGMLAAAMPGDDIDLLNRSLEKVVSSTLDLKTLAGEVDFAIEDHRVDANALRRLTRLAGELDELQKTITKGHQGLGRARFGLAITPGTVAQWAGEFPYNSFQSPVIIDLTGETAQIAAGLLEGHLRDTCESVALLKKARLEIDQAPGLDFERAKLDKLQWKDLTEDERRFCPPLIVVGNDEALAGPGLSQMLWLLSSDLPVKIVALADLDYGVARRPGRQKPVPHHYDPRTNLALLGLGTRNAYVAQTSIADFDHMQASVSDALEYAGPALIRVHVPSPGRHGVPMDSAIRQAELAVRSRAHPLFTYDPRKEGVYGTRISLTGNPEVEAAWLNTETGSLTPADWALTESRFRSCFAQMRDEDGPGVPLIEYLALDASARSGKTPVLVVGEDEEARQYAIRPELIGVIEETGSNWQFLQELAGVSTPFTEKVWAEAREGVIAEHQAEMDALKAEYEAKIDQLTSNVQSEMASRIRGQLMNLVRLKSVDAQADVTVDE